MKTRKISPRGLLALLLLAAVPVVAQIQEEDLPPETFTQLAYERYTFDELQERFRVAETAFNEAVDPVSVLPAFGELIEILSQRQAEAPRPDAERRLLTEALSYRARANFNQGALEQVDDDLQAMLAVLPDFQLDPSVVSPKLLSRYEEMQKRVVGHLDLSIQPLDATVTVAGREVDATAGPVAAFAGTVAVRVERLGFAPAAREIEVRAGRLTDTEIVLVRESAVLGVITWPRGARLSLNGRPAGLTEGTLPEGRSLPAEALHLPRDQVSDVLRVGGLQPGTYRLEVAMEGFRPYRAEVTIGELVDYETGLLVLEATEAVVTLDPVPQGAEILVNGREVRPEGRALVRRLRLSPGDYVVAVRHPDEGVFERRLSLEDRDSVTLQVRLRPALVLLGVLGGDRVAAGKLEAEVSRLAGELESWTFLDRREPGLEAAAGAGLDVQTLRQAGGPMLAGQGVDWRGVQAEVGRAVPGSVYLLAVLSDDLLATEADLWFWPAAPGPPRPDRQRVTLGDPADMGRVMGAFAVPAEVRRPWLGALLIDSEAAEGPVIADLDSAGPAAQAGLRTGDEVLAVFGERASGAAAVQEVLETLRPGASFSLEVRNAAGRRTLDIRLGSSPAVVRLNDPRVVYAAVSAGLAASLEDRDAQAPEWLLLLNEAAVYLQGGAWEDAVRVLRRVEAPEGAGLGQAAVDYWLAIALRAAGPSYLDQARAALERAASVPGARLYHNDGPLVAPRARARLSELGSGR